MGNPESDNHDNERKESPASGSDFILRRSESEKPPGKSGLVITYKYPDMSNGVPVYVFEGECLFRRIALDDERDYFIASVAPEEPGLASVYKIDPEELPELNLLNLAGACEADNLLAALQIGDCEDIELMDRGLDFPDTLRIEYCSADDLVREDRT